VMPCQTVEKLMKEFPSSFTALVQSMIKVYNLKASSKWEDVIKGLQDRHGIESAEEAFAWFCEHVEADRDDLFLSAPAFEIGMLRLKVQPLDCKIFWAELDVARSGHVSLKEFLENMPSSAFGRADDAGYQRNAGREPTYSFRSSMAKVRDSVYSTGRGPNKLPHKASKNGSVISSLGSNKLPGSDRNRRSFAANRLASERACTKETIAETSGEGDASGCEGPMAVRFQKRMSLSSPDSSASGRTLPCNSDTAPNTTNVRLQLADLQERSRAINQAAQTLLRALQADSPINIPKFSSELSAGAD